MNPRVMLVEDEEALVTLLQYNLEQEGYDVEVVGRGDEAELRLQETMPSLLLLDWMLPGLSGIELCRRLRAGDGTKRLPIIMLTARSEESERIRGLSVGADDYVVKPFSTSELMARIKNLLRRTNPSLLDDMLKVNDITLDKASHRVYRRDRTIKVGPTEFRLLEFLMRAPGRVFSREQLLNGVWGDQVYVDERTVDVHIGRLRKALTVGNSPDYIRTVRGAGYSLEVNGPKRL